MGVAHDSSKTVVSKSSPFPPPLSNNRISAPFGAIRVTTRSETHICRALKMTESFSMLKSSTTEMDENAVEKSGIGTCTALATTYWHSGQFGVYGGCVAAGGGHVCAGRVVLLEVVHVLVIEVDVSVCVSELVDSVC